MALFHFMCVIVLTLPFFGWVQHFHRCSMIMMFYESTLVPFDPAASNRAPMLTLFNGVRSNLTFLSPRNPCVHFSLVASGFPWKRPPTTTCWSVPKKNRSLGSVWWCGLQWIWQAWTLSLPKNAVIEVPLFFAPLVYCLVASPTTCWEKLVVLIMSKGSQLGVDCRFRLLREVVSFRRCQVDMWGVILKTLCSFGLTKTPDCLVWCSLLTFWNRWW